MDLIHAGLWLTGAVAWTAVVLLLAERAVDYFKAWKRGDPAQFE